MEPAPIPAPVQAFAPDFARRFSLIVTALSALIARRFLREPRFAALIIPLCNRLNRAVRRFERLMVRLAAGNLPKPRPPGASSSTSPGTPAPASPDPPPSAIAIPTGRLWLIRVLGYEAAGYASQLEALLAEPAAAALLAEVPAAKRLVHPVGRLLGLSACAFRRRPRAPRPPKPRPPPLPPIRPTSPYPSAHWPWLSRSFRPKRA